MKVAYYSPLPPERSGIADYSALLLPELERRIEVDVVRRPGRRVPRGTDLALYHVGNDPEHHWWIVEALRKRPGVVVLHDFVLHHLVAGMTLGRKNSEGYLDAMQREAGPVGRMLAHGVIDGLLPPVWERRAHEYPLTGEVLTPRHRRDRPLRVRRAPRPRARVRGTCLADSASRLARARGRARRPAGRPLRRRLLRPPEPGEAAAAAARRLRAPA